MPTFLPMLPNPIDTKRRPTPKSSHPRVQQDRQGSHKHLAQPTAKFLSNLDSVCILIRSLVTPRIAQAHRLIRSNHDILCSQPFRFLVHHILAFERATFQKPVRHFLCWLAVRLRSEASVGRDTALAEAHTHHATRSSQIHGSVMMESGRGRKVQNIVRILRERTVTS